MAKQAILDVLESTIGKYVRNLDAESLNVAVWKGQIELNSLELDIDSINAELDRQAAESPNLALPFRVVGGGFGNFQVDVPWARITSQPVVLRANKLSVVVEPFDRTSHAEHLVVDEQTIERRIQKINAQREQNLKVHDDYRLRSNALRELAAEDVVGGEDGDHPQKAGFAERLVRRIIENLQVDINNVHISLKGIGGSAGVVLGSLSLFTTDKNGTRKFVDRAKGVKTEEDSFLFKVLQIKGLGVYLDEALPFQRKSAMDMEHEFILVPLSFEARLRQADSTKCIDYPKYLLNSELSDLSILLSRNQLELGNKIVSTMRPSMNAVRPLFPEYRPLTRITKECSRDWWHYAFRCVGRLNRRRSWVEFFRAFQKRKLYIPLYKRSSHSAACSWLSPLSDDEKKQLFDLEHDRSISMEGFMAWRNIADAQVEREQRKYDATLNERKKEAGGIMAAFFGSSGASTSKPSGEDDPPITLTTEEMQELEAISLEQATEAELSDDSKLCDLSFVLGSFKVNLVGHGLRQLAAFHMGAVRTSFDANADGSYSFDLSLLSLEVHDKVTPRSVFPMVLRNIGKDDEAAFTVSLRKAKNGDQNTVMKLVAFETVASPLLITEVKRFFSLSGSAPISTGLHTNPMLRESLSGTVDLFYDADPGQVSRMKFDQETDTAAQSVAISDKLASAMADAWKSKTRQKAKWTVDFDFHAPFLIVPESCSSPSSNVLVFNFGRLRLKYGYEDRSAKVTEWFNKESQPRNSHIIFDAGSVNISELTFTIGKAGDTSWREVLADRSHSEPTSRPVLEQLSASLEFGVEGQSLSPRICAFGMISAISLSVSPRQISGVLAVYSGWKSVIRELQGSPPTESVHADNEATESGLTIVDEVSLCDDEVEGTRSPRRLTELLSVRAPVFGSNDDIANDALNVLTVSHVEVSLKRFSVRVLGDTGQGVEAHLVSVSASSSQKSDGSLSAKLCMGWFWILDRLAYDIPRRQRLMAHSSLPKSASAFAENDDYDVLGELQRMGVFEDSFEGSTDLADINITIDGSSERQVSFDTFSCDPSIIDAQMSVDANLSSLYLHWNPRVVKAVTLAFSKTVESINDAYRSSLIFQNTRLTSPRRSSMVETGRRHNSVPSSARPPSVMIMNAAMKSLQICLASALDDEPLFILTMADAQTSFLSVQKEQNNLKISLELGDVRIESSSTARTYTGYRTMLGLAPNQSASLLGVQYFSGSTALNAFSSEGVDISKCNSCARIELSPMRFVHIQAQVLTLVEYVTDGILGTLAAKAASSAADAALELVHMEGGENFFAIRATGINLTLPQSAGEREHLSLHTGNLDIDFRGFPYPGGGSVHVRLSKVEVQDHMDQKMLDRPIEMSVGVEMAPDGLGSKDDQAMRIKIEIAEAPFLISHNQYQQIMWTLHGNISEADPCLRESTLKAEQENIDSNWVHQDEVALQDRAVLTHAGVAQVEKENRMYIDFQVRLLSLEVHDTDLSEPIALLKAEKSSILLKMIPDEKTLFTEATLQNLTVEDRRVGFLTRPFRSVMHRADSDAGSSTDVFYVSYKNVDNRSSEVNLRIGSPQIVLIPDLVGDILQFLSIEKPADAKPSTIDELKLIEPLDGRTREEVIIGSASNQESLETTLVTFVESTESAESTSMSISIKSADCSVVLIDTGGSATSVQDRSSSILSSANSSETESMVLRGKFNASTSYSSEVDSNRLVEASVEVHGEHMEIFTAYGSSFASPIQVLEPVDMSCFLNVSPRDISTKELQVRTVTLSPVLLTFSMQNAALLNAIYAGVMESFAGKPIEKSVDDPVIPMNEQQTQRISQLTTALQGNIEVESDGSLMGDETRFRSEASSFNASSDVGDVLSIISRINFTFPEASITVINDLRGLDDALFRITVKNFVAGAEIVQDVVPSADTSSIRTTFDSDINLALMADFFDSSVGLWKVLLRRPWELTLKCARGNSRRIKSDRLSTTVDLESFPCHVSFSERFLVSLAAAGQMWSIYSMTTQKAAEEFPEQLAKRPRKSFAASAARRLITSLPYAIENHSGADVSFAITSESTERMSCPSGILRYFRFIPPESNGYGGQRLYGQDVTQPKSLALFVEGREILIHHIDAELSRPRHAHVLSDGRYLLSHVTKDGTTTVLHLSSPVDIQNRCSLPFSIAVECSDAVQPVGTCGMRQTSSLQPTKNAQRLDEDTVSVQFTRPTTEFGVPVSLLGGLTESAADDHGVSAVLRVSPCLQQNIPLVGEIVIPSLRNVLNETATASGYLLRRFDVTFRAMEHDSLSDSRSPVPDPLVAQICLVQTLVDRKFPFIQMYLEPRIVLENRIPVGIRVRTPMPHTLIREGGGRKIRKSLSESEDDFPDQVVHELSAREAIEVFTPGPSIAVSIMCSDQPIAGGKTTWMEGGWVDIPLVHDYRLPEPLKCVFPFLERQTDDYGTRRRGDGSEFMIVEDGDLKQLLLGEKASGGSDSSTPHPEALEVVATQSDTKCRKILITVINYAVDHTGEVLFEKLSQVDQTNLRGSATVDSRRRGPRLHEPSSPFSAFSLHSQMRVSLLPDSTTPISLLQLSMESPEGFRRSQPFLLEDVTTGEGGVDCSAIRWQDNTESGYFAYRRLLDAYQFELHIIPEYLIFNGSKNYRVTTIQHEGEELTIESTATAPARSSQSLGLTISLAYRDFGGRTAAIRVDSLGFRVSVVKAADGALLGTVAIQTVIGNADSRLVVKLGDVKFGDSMVTQGTARMEADTARGILSSDILRLRIRWSELKVTLNETRPLNVDDERNIAFVETALDQLVETNSGTEAYFKRQKSPRGWMEARQDYFEEQEEIEKHTQRPICTVVLSRFTVDWQRMFKSGSTSTVESRSSLLSSERSQFSMIIHEVNILDSSANAEFPVVFESGSNVSFFDLCIRTKGPLNSDVVKVDLFDLNLAHRDGNSERIAVKTSEEFVWKLIDLVDRIIVAVADLAGVDLKLEWDERQGGYVATVSEKVSNHLDEGTQIYTPPQSDRLYSISRARVSPFVAMVSFKRKPQASRYGLVKGKSKVSDLMNYFTTQLKFTIDKADLRFARYDASNIQGPSDRLIEMLAAVYMSRMKLKVVSLMTAATFQDWKNLASREGGDDEFVDGDILRATGNFAGRTVGYVFKKVGRGVGSGMTHVASSIGNEIENATDKVGARAVGAGVNSVVTGLGTGVGSTVTGVGEGAGKVLKGAGKGVGQVFGGFTGGVMMAGKGIGKGITQGDGKAMASGLADGATSIGTGVGRGVESAVMGAADGVLSCGQGIFSGFRSVGKGVAGAFTGGGDCGACSPCWGARSDQEGRGSTRLSNPRNLLMRRESQNIDDEHE